MVRRLRRSDEDPLRTIAVINQKGGVGKTTTTCNLGAGLARSGKRVLLIDFDPQANLTAHLESKPFEMRASTYDLLRGEASLKDVIVPTAIENLFLAPSAGDLAAAEIELIHEIARESMLKKRLVRGVEECGGFDYVLIDCAPQLGLLAINALAAADEMLVPIQAEFFSLQGLSRLLDTQKRLAESVNPALELKGIVICMWKGQANLSREVRDDVRKVFGEVVFETLIRQNVKLAEAPSAGRTIFEHDPLSNGAVDYLDLTLEFLARHGDRAETPTVGLAPAENAQKIDAPDVDEKGSARAAQPRQEDSGSTESDPAVLGAEFQR
jgi:chromosome partitioning protein